MQTFSSELKRTVFDDYLPKPPDWRVPREEMTERFSWLRDMQGCRQDPVWHAEGDVWIHSAMVAQELANLIPWRQLPYDDRLALFMTAVMHDIAKPHCTTLEDGRIRSHGHARRGATMARRILWNLGVPFDLREKVCALIQFHMAPSKAYRDPKPYRKLIEASLRVENRLLHLFAQADVRGRIAPDLDEKLEEIDFFRELCRSRNCFIRPYAFPSDHTRIIYFQDVNRDPRYAVFDDTNGHTVTFMSGLPASGKDHWVRENANGHPVVSLDDLRKSMKVDPAKDQGRVIQAARALFREHLRANRSFIFNATNINCAMRSPFVQLAHDYKAKIRFACVEADPATIRARNNRRDRPVPDKVIGNMVGRWEIPDLTEGHQVEYVITC